MLDFIAMAYTLGPMVTTSYGLQVLGMTPQEIFLYLSVLNIVPIPVLFKLFEFGGKHKEIYRLKVLRKASAVTRRQLGEVMAYGDRIVALFEERLGQLGFYLALAVLTFIFGVVWASLVAYILVVRRKMAMLSISVGVLVGNLFWLALAQYSQDYITPVGVLAICVSVPLLVYGSRREMEVLKGVAAHLKIELVKDSAFLGLPPKR